VAVVDQALQSILDNPEACPVWRTDRPYRKRSLKRFPYVVFYCLDSATVEIVAVAHAKRRPGYWLERLR
jgi:plasmid stabilization system protein ParE